MDNIFFTNPNLKFQVSNGSLTKEQIESVIAQDFKGKNDFVHFIFYRTEYILQKEQK